MLHSIRFTTSDITYDVEISSQIKEVRESPCAALLPHWGHISDLETTTAFYVQSITTCKSNTVIHNKQKQCEHWIKCYFMSFSFYKNDPELNRWKM